MAQCTYIQQVNALVNITHFPPRARSKCNLDCVVIVVFVLIVPFIHVVVTASVGDARAFGTAHDSHLVIEAECVLFFVCRSWTTSHIGAVD